MKKELASALNDQMVFELYSSYIYLGLAACLEKMKLPGAAHWMRIQVDEEIIHAGIFYNYLNDQSEDIVLDTIKKPELGKIRTPLDAFKEALKHEKLVTARINKLVELSIKSGGYATMAFLNFFVTEQVQEFGASEVHPFKRRSVPSRRSSTSSKEPVPTKRRSSSLMPNFRRALRQRLRRRHRPCNAGNITETGMQRQVLPPLHLFLFPVSSGSGL